jgi:hypothetical protein
VADAAIHHRRDGKGATARVCLSSNPSFTWSRTLSPCRVRLGGIYRGGSEHERGRERAAEALRSRQGCLRHADF